MRNIIIALVFSLTLGACESGPGRTDSIAVLPLAILVGVGVAAMAH